MGNIGLFPGVCVYVLPDQIHDNYTEYTEAFRAKLHKINAVLDTFHYDDSNGMVDYFDTNFYRDITVVAA